MASHIHNKPILHHTREIEDMRQSFRRSLSHHSDQQSSSQSSATTSSQSESENSYRSNHTQPTDCSSPSDRTTERRRRQAESEAKQRYLPDRPMEESPSASVISIASSEPSEEDDANEVPDYDIPRFKASTHATAPPIPSTPSDFSTLFPSRRRLYIHHDDSTPDGNMNLRLDTTVDLSDGRRADMTLFHLRMHDLRTRTFSLRRHCRDSGREVCHTARKERGSGSSSASKTGITIAEAPPTAISTAANATPTRPGLPRSLSNALHSMRPKLTHDSGRSGATRPASFDLKRHDSGYASIRSGISGSGGHAPDESAPWHRRPSTSAGVPAAAAAKPRPELTSTIRMDFTNYAQAEVRRVGSRKGSGAAKRYEFAYWGVQYAWRRVVRKDRGAEARFGGGAEGDEEVSYHLTRFGSGVGGDAVLARIEPTILTPDESDAERARGGWVPPSSFWILDEGLLGAQKDVADVIVASGLMALVDDSIRARFGSPASHNHRHPGSKRLSITSRFGIEYVGPKRFVAEILERAGNGVSSAQHRASLSLTSSRRPSTSGAGAVKRADGDGRGVLFRQQSSHV